MECSDAGLTKVKILNQFYHIRSDGDPAYIRKVADYVDRKLKQVAGTTPSADTLKVALLTALHIADELFEARKAHTENEDWFWQKLRECDLLLDELC
ncbi:MAG: cell division protein ZapA [Acidobacteria bacterium]|nr:cell division protein ZapA [Acidobacteriota bacterium]